jgi:ABC-2 type transport system permease protein
MNPIDRYLLQFFMLFKPVYLKLGAQSLILKSILTARLIKDDRQVYGFYKNTAKAQDSMPGTTIVNIIFSFLFGLMLLFSFLFPDDMTRMTFYFTFYMLSSSMLLILKSANSLFDPIDNYIILPRPVNSITFILSRVLHILISTSKIAIPMIYSKGIWAGFIFLLMSAMLVLFSVNLVTFVYLLLIKLLGPAKFNVFIDAIQIISGIAIMLTGRIISNLFETTFFNDFILAFHWKLLFFPPYWFAGTWKFLYTLLPDPIGTICVILCVGLSILCAWLILKYYSKMYLDKMYQTSREDTRITFTGISQLINWISIHVFKNQIERAGFLFGWKLLARNRDFKLAAYPMVGYLILGFLVPMIILFSDSFLNPQEMNSPKDRFGFVMLMYSPNIISVILLGYLPFSEKFKSAWIFFMSPIDKPGRILTGSVKALLLKFYIPIITVVCIINMSLFGFKFVPNFIFGIICSLFIFFIVVLFGLNKLPFSCPWKENQSKGLSILIIILSFLLNLFFSLLHYFIFNYNYTLIILAIGIGITNYFIVRSIKNTEWRDMKLEGIRDEL